MLKRCSSIDAVRTPIGRYGGRLAAIRPDDLAAGVVRALVDRSPALDPAAIDDVYLGDANGAGEDNRDVARMAVLLAGLPDQRARRHGQPAVRVWPGGGDRSQPRGRPRRCVARARGRGRVDDAGRRGCCRSPTAPSSAATRRCTRPRSAGAWSTRRCPSEWTMSLGESAEILADQVRRSRARRRTPSPCAAIASPPRPGTRAGSTPRSCPSPAPTWSATRASGRRARSRRWPSCGRSSGPRGRSRPGTRRRSATARRRSSSATSGPRRRSAATRSPASSPAAPPESTPTCSGSRRSRRPGQALGRAGIGFEDLAVVELNEAFASQSLACLAEWPELDPDLVNPNGGAIAIGHPLGCSGARILGSLAHELHRRGGGRGLAAICIGVGQGLAMVLEA